MDQKAQERIAIAKDALKWIRAGVLEPSEGVYVRPQHQPTAEQSDLQLRDVVLGHCRVCAKGAIFLAKAVRYDNVLAKDWSGGNSQTTDSLQEHFDLDQLTLIECAFEGWVRTAEDVLGGDAGQKVKSFFRANPDEKKRLVAILKNIIKNQGTFVLPAVEEVGEVS